MKASTDGTLVFRSAEENEQTLRRYGDATGKELHIDPSFVFRQMEAVTSPCVTVSTGFWSAMARRSRFSQEVRERAVRIPGVLRRLILLYIMYVERSRYAAGGVRA